MSLAVASKVLERSQRCEEHDSTYRQGRRYGSDAAPQKSARVQCRQRRRSRCELQRNAVLRGSIVQCLHKMRRTGAFDARSAEANPAKGCRE